MDLKTSLHVAAAGALLIASGAVIAADAATMRLYPTPGLYRVDIQGNLQWNQGNSPAITQQTIQDGASGTVQLKSGRAGQAPVTTNYGGQGPAHVCIKPLLPSGAVPPTTNCKTSAPVAGPGSLGYTSVCGGMTLNTTIKKIDAKTWEYKLVTVDTGAPMTGLPDFAGTRAVLAAQAKNAATPAERAEAAKALSQMGAYEAEMKKNAADLAKAHAGLAAEQGAGAAAAGKETMKRTIVQRLTRIADSCGATAAR